MYKYKSGNIFHGMGPFLEGIKVDAKMKHLNPGLVGLYRPTVGDDTLPIFFKYGLSGAVIRIPINQAL